MDDKLLIELVHSYPALYDLSNSKYMDSSFKQEIWKKIGEEMKVDGSLCRSRWNNIRDNYRKSLRKTETKNRQSAKKIKHYKYSEQLNFLNSFIHERETKGSLLRHEAEGHSNDEHVHHTQDDEEESILNDLIEPTTPLFSSKQTSEPTLKLSKRRTAKKKMAPQHIKQEKPSTPHPVEAFLAGITPTLKSLSPYYLNKAKSEIFNTVQKYEMEMLVNQQTFETTSRHSTSMSSASTTSTPVQCTDLKPEEEGNEYIKLKLIGQVTGEFHFRVKMTTQMVQLKKSYCERVSFHVFSLNFIFDGRRIKDEDTPQSLKMEDDDIIQVHLSFTAD